jgi:hypothetical protein
MATTITLRDYIDLPEWRVLAQPVSGSSSTTLSSTGIWIADDYRNNDYASGINYLLTGQNILIAYHNKTDSWGTYLSGFNSAGTFGTGCTAVFIPSLSPIGLLLAGSTSTQLNLDTIWNAPAAATWTRSGSTITVTTTRPHKLAASQFLYLQASSDVSATGPLSFLGGPTAIYGASNIYTVATVVSATQFTFTGVNAGAASGTLTIGPYVMPNRLANRGDGKGMIIRVIGNGPGSSGKIEERHVVNNTVGTTPVITLDEPLSFTPVAGDSFEFLTGSFVAMNTGTSSTTGIFKRYDITTGLTSNLSTTGLLATIPTTSNLFIATDEGYVPHTRKCYEGYYVGTATYDTSNTLTGGTKGCLQATATGATSLTGQASGGDAVIIANQYRNYQLRIVEDTAIPTAVGQRRRIISHTAGTSPVYTVAAWTVTPSATCKYVLENWTDNLLYFAGGTTVMYNYTHTNYTGVGTLGAWDTTTWAAKPNSSQSTGGFAVHTFGILPDSTNQAKASSIFLFRGSSQYFDLFDVAGAATGSWLNTLYVVDWPQFGIDSFGTTDQSTLVYNPHNQEGRYVYFYPGTNSSTTTAGRSAIKFDTKTWRYERISGVRMVSGTLSITAKLAWISVFQDGNTKIAFWNTIRPMSVSDVWQLAIYK